MDSSDICCISSVFKYSPPSSSISVILPCLSLGCSNSCISLYVCVIDSLLYLPLNDCVQLLHPVFNLNEAGGLRLTRPVHGWFHIFQLICQLFKFTRGLYWFSLRQLIFNSVQVIIHLHIWLVHQFPYGQALLLHILVEHVELVGQLWPVVFQVGLVLNWSLLDFI